jgi:hypothetical protein
MKHLLYLIAFLLPICLRGQSISIVTSDTSICAGTSVAFVATASGVSTPHYRWTINSSVAGSDNSMFITATLSNQDTVRCLLTDTGGTVLAASDSFVIRVRYAPSAGSITGRDTVCEGTTITLSASTPGGTWMASNTHATVVNGIVSGVRAGESFECHTDTAQDDILYIVSDACGTDTARKTVTIHPRPYASLFIYSPYFSGSLCVRQSVYFNYWGVGACGEMHSTTGNVFASIIAMSGVNPGTDYIYCVATNYCGSDTAGISVTVVAPLDSIRILSTTSSLCIGDSDTLRASTSGFMTRWYSNGTLSLISPYDSITRVSTQKTGLDTITLSVQDQCGIVYDTKVVTVNPMPALSLVQQEVCRDYPTMFSSTTPGGVWASSKPNTVTAIDGWITGLLPGTATVTYTLPTGCFTSANIQVADCASVIRLFPDPVTDELVIHLLATGYYTTYGITNELGQPLSSGQIMGRYTSVSTTSLIPGMYFLTARGPGGHAVQRFIKN